MKLTDTEIKKRLIRLHNLEKLHPIAIKRNEVLKQENRELKERVNILEIRDKEKDTIIETLKLQIEELQQIVFGKKKHKEEENDEDNTHFPKEKESLSRSKDFYKRDVPKEKTITGKYECKINKCPDCKTELSRKETKKFYIEDIEIPKKTIIEQTIERGFCGKCRKYHSKIPLPTSKVIIGENIRNHVAYMSTILRLSYSQIVDDLMNRFNFNISSGEIDRILRKKALGHSIEYEQLKKLVQKEYAMHFDETGDRVRDGDGYKAHTWLMQGANKPEVYFKMGQTRGKGVAEKMLGKSKAIGISDDYGVYTSLFAEHQLCWAHLHRKLRDLAESKTLNKISLSLCREVFVQETVIYSKVRELSNRDDLSEEQRKNYVIEISKKLKDLSEINFSDPEKLKTYKKTLAKNIHKYLTCICLPNVPCDNNQAERTLRHVVLKRKISFGHISAKGAETMSILMSIFLTIKNRIKNTDQTFFKAYEEFSV